MTNQNYRVIRALHHFRLLAFAFFLPLIIVILLLIKWGNALVDATNLITPQTVILLTLLLICFCYNLFLIYKLLDGIDKINNRLRKIIPIYKLPKSEMDSNNKRMSYHLCLMK